jgi:hypothetical protein
MESHPSIPDQSCRNDSSDLHAVYPDCPHEPPADVRKFAARVDPLDRKHRDSDYGDEGYQSTLKDDLGAHRDLSLRGMRMKRD